MNKLKSLVQTFVETATIKRALLATLLFGILMYIIDYSPIGVAGLLEITGGANILDFEKSYSVEKAYQMLSALGEAGRSFYLHRILPTDIFFPMGVMLFFSCWLSLFLKYLTAKDSPLRMLVCLAVFNMCCDWGENIGFTAMLLNYPAKLTVVCTISSTITTIKFICVAALFLCLTVLLSACLIKMLLTWKKAAAH